MNKSEAQSARQTIPFTEDQLSQMADLYAKVKSLRLVGDRFGISREAVRSRLINRGVQMRDFGPPKMYSDMECMGILEKRESGFGVNDLSAQLDVSESTIKRAIIRARQIREN